MTSYRSLKARVTIMGFSDPPLKIKRLLLTFMQDDLEKRIALAFNALGQGDQPPVALSVDSPASGSSQAVGTTFAPDTEEAITCTAYSTGVPPPTVHENPSGRTPNRQSPPR
jgi:hypothetical protein